MIIVFSHCCKYW